MPYQPKRPCRHPGCPNLTNNRAGYCAVHSQEVDNYRDNANQRGYNSTWRRIRHLYLKDNPLCGVCNQTGRITAAEVVHHKDRNPKNNDSGNLVALCVDCHAKEHGKDRSEQGGMKC